ncbi:NADPH-dependent FMN reductase [Alteromonas mediterranea]|uniref:NADPH-dependent FMN reductase n=1 Tax=Alteromonas mediterranea TaxID=314275 RepID=UPI0003557782|nr:NAD(P)H-dependent oxidoreductase [Alteromonas mediterranea]AGP84914.1 flavoprotein [Alteromonas mediterranea U4]AGP89045.1 flavoprotein [Alteromonas mediterranea U7]AGP92901.1 flavoprotein [Alteromonas mediterranea U8]|tara:strand:- start:1627 stop:2193 length:567 start_codon:yes stop_codon:yes gene_type:complete
MTKILAFAGSTRKGSFNHAIVNVAAEGARDAGAEVTVIDLADYQMPIFNEDDEAEFGMPEKAQAFKELLMSHDGFLIASPEYNSSYPALLKNAIDWASRMGEGEKPLQAYRGKVAGIMAASAGGLGGMRVLVVLRMLLENLGTMVLPNQKAISKVNTLMEDGVITDEKTIKQLKNLGKETAELAVKLA